MACCWTLMHDLNERDVVRLYIYAPARNEQNRCEMVNFEEKPCY